MHLNDEHLNISLLNSSGSRGQN